RHRRSLGQGADASRCACQNRRTRRASQRAAGEMDVDAHGRAADGEAARRSRGAREIEIGGSGRRGRQARADAGRRADRATARPLMPTTILITGLGPFPGAPFNPTMPLVHRLARLRRPGLSDVRLIGHVFETRYGAVDRELPELITRHRPDALLMFGVATRRKRLSIETRARNALALLPDAGSASLGRQALAPGRASALRMPAPL